MLDPSCSWNQIGNVNPGCILGSLWCCYFEHMFQVRFMSARASVAFITDQVEEIKQRQFVELVPGIVQVRVVQNYNLLYIKLKCG